MKEILIIGLVLVLAVLGTMAATLVMQGVGMHEYNRRAKAEREWAKTLEKDSDIAAEADRREDETWDPSIEGLASGTASQ